MKPLVVVAILVLAGCSPEEAKHKAAGNVLFKQGDLAGAAKEYRAAVAANPKDPNGHTLLGNALFESEHYAEAKAEYDTALQLDKKARAARQGVAMVALRNHDAAAAEAAYRQLIADEPRDAEAHVALGKLRFAAKDWDGAEKQLRDALVYAQNDPSALYTLGLVLAHKKDPGAQAIFERLERATPGKAYAPYGRAVAAATGGDTKGALDQLQLALERGVDDVAAVESDEAFASLKAEPRFAELLAAARARTAGKQ